MRWYFIPRRGIIVIITRLLHGSANHPRPFTDGCRPIPAFHHIDVHRRVANHFGAAAIASAIDGTDTRKRMDIHLRVGLPACARCLRCPISLIPIDRVGSLIAAAIQFADNDGLTANLIDIHFDGSFNGATDVVAAEHTVESSVGDIQRDITMDVGSLSATIDILQARDTRHQQDGIGIHGRTLTTTVSLVNMEMTALHIVKQGQGRLTHVTLGVRAAKDTMDETAININRSLTGAIAKQGGALFFRTGGRVIVRAISRITHIGTGVVTAVRQFVGTVAATKQFLNLERAINGDVRGWCRGRITAAIHRADARQVTAVDDDGGMGLFFLLLRAGSLCRHIRRLVATTIDGLHVIAGLHLRRLLALGRISYCRSDSVLGSIDMNCSRPGGGAIHIIATEDAATHYAATGIVCNTVVQLHQSIAHRGRDFRTAHTAAINITCHRATRQIDRGVASVSQCTAAVDRAANRGTAALRPNATCQQQGCL